MEAGSPTISASAISTPTAASRVRLLEHRAREHWAKENPSLARVKARPGSYEEVAHLVYLSDWEALKPVHRAMMSRLVTQARAGLVGVMPCFAPGTSAKTIRAFESVSNSLQFYRASNFWESTSAGPHRAGAPVTLSWSIVPDGTMIAGGAGEATTPSTLRASLDSLYGNETTWRALFRGVFARWAAVAGLRYVEEFNDDGAPMTLSGSNPGLAGVRGDVRISSHVIDGARGILAYNLYPDNGDMVLDAADFGPGGFAGNTDKDSLGLRNVITHEHGHGLGLAHVCPVNGTKLMEPTLSYNFDGPQLDDIESAQRGYGDTLEANDSQETGTDLRSSSNLKAIGAPDGTISLSMMSINGRDLDFYKISPSSPKMLSARLRPIGANYAEGPQEFNGSCGAGTPFNAAAQKDLQIAVLSAKGQVVASVNATGIGGAELLSGTRLSTTGGPYSVRVSGDASDKIQLYNLTLTLDDAPSSAILVQDGRVTLNDAQGNGNNNGLPDPGESSLSVTLPMQNIGDTMATNVHGTLVSLTPGVIVSQPKMDYPNLGVGNSYNNNTLPTFALSPAFSCGTTIQMRLDMQSDQGNSSVDISLATGNLSVQNFAYTGAPVPIPDGPGQNVGGPIAEATLDVSGASQISDLDVVINDLPHSYVGDLVVSLTSPAGTTVTLIDRIGDGYTRGPNFAQAILDDDAATSIEKATNSGTALTGSFMPANPLSAFDGQNPNGTWKVSLQDFYNGDVGTLNAFSLRLTSTQCGVPAPVVSPTSGALISEYRLSGPGGNTDEFIELINTTNAPLDLSGWSVLAGSLTIPVPAGTTPIPARGHLLMTGSGYSLANLGGTGAAAGNVLFTTDVPTGSALALRNAAGTLVDQVSSSGMPVPLSLSDDYSYVRRLDNGSAQDTDSDLSDFNLVDVQSTVGPNNQTGISNGLLRLGAPGPENLASPPQFNALVTFTPASQLRVGSGNGGTLALRYVLTNRAGSGRTITALRFRVTALTAGTTAVATDGTASIGPADIRLICSKSSDGTVLPLIVETPPAQPNGGGLNSTLSLAALPGGSLAPGQSVTVELLYNVVQRGFYRFALNLEPVVTP